MNNESEDLIMMVEKFIKDYAEVKKNEIKINTEIRNEIKEIAIKNIDKAVSFRERGVITRDEAISIIMNCFKKNS